MGDDDNDLIPALVFEQDLTTERERKIGIRRQLVRDKRSGLTDPPRRCLRVFTDVERTDWGPKLRERLEKLSRRPFAHVSRPLEIGRLENGEVYVICDKHDDVLDSRIRGDAGLVEDDADKTLAWKLFAEIAEGLAALHNAEMPHGELQPKVIGYEKESKTAWVEGVVEGPLCYWTSHRYPVDKDALPYLPPKWQEKQVPSKEADLYALGRIGIAMLLGKPENNWESFDQSDFDRELKKANVKRARRKLLLSLISPDPEKRPSAAVVLERLRRSECARVWLLLWIGAIVALIALIAAATGFVFQRWQLQGTRATLTATEAELKTTRSDLGETKTDLSRQTEKLTNTKAQLDTAHLDLDKCKHREPPPPPVDPPLLKAEVERRATVEANRLWHLYAAKEGKTFDNLRHIFHEDESIFIANDTSIRREARKKLLSWLAQFERRSGERWTIQFGDKPDCKENAPCIRGMRIYIGGKYVDPGLLDTAKIKPQGIEWSVDQGIRIVLYDFSPGEGRTWKKLWWDDPDKWPVIYDHEFSGPVAIWLLKRYTLSGGKEGPRLNVEVVDCPGPIPKYIEPQNIQVPQ